MHGLALNVNTDLRYFSYIMIGTAATMQIEENLALAARRGQRRGLGPGITREEQEEYKEQLKMLGLGLENRLTSKVGLLSGGQRQALTLLMASLKKPKLDVYKRQVLFLQLNERQRLCRQRRPI